MKGPGELIDKLYHALLLVQWGSHAQDPDGVFYQLCPHCNQPPHRGHAPDCEVGMALEARCDASAAAANRKTPIEAVVCSHCGAQFIPHHRNAPRGRRRFCTTCRVQGKPQRYSLADWRERQKKRREEGR
jgi:ribosomal protein L32